MSTILLVGTLDEAREIPHRGIRVMSCGQHPGSFHGLRVTAVYATPAAKGHRNYDKVLATLRRCAAKTRPFELKRATEIERVV